MIVQQTRKEDKTILESTYNKLNVKCTVKEFFDDVQNEIYNSDIVIARCGASTLAEIEYCKSFLYCFLFLLRWIIINLKMLNNLRKK